MLIRNVEVFCVSPFLNFLLSVQFSERKAEYDVFRVLYVFLTRLVSLGFVDIKWISSASIDVIIPNIIHKLTPSDMSSLYFIAG